MAKDPGVVGRVRSLDVDGAEIAGNLIPLPAQAGDIVEVSARVEPTERRTPPNLPAAGPDGRRPASGGDEGG